MIINNPSILKEMMEDMKKSPEIYKPGNFWMFYIEKLAKQIEKSDLNNFRNWICGPGSIASFGGGREMYGLKYGSNIHPFFDAFKKFDNSFLVKSYNYLLNKLAKLIPILGIFSFRGAIARTYFEEKNSTLQQTAWFISKMFDQNKTLEQVQDSKEGNPNGFKIKKNFYTLRFLKEMMQIFFIEKQVSLKDLKVVLEIGAGVGLKASAFLKMNPKITYIIVDLPPALYVSQQYLISQNYKVFTYSDAKKIKSLAEVNLEDFNVICLAPWMIDKIINDSVDLFINVFSFQEMEPWLVKNYLNKISSFTKKYIYLLNMKEGHAEVKEKGQHGVLKQTKSSDYINFLNSKFILKTERDFTSIHGIEPDSNEMFFTRINS